MQNKCPFYLMLFNWPNNIIIEKTLEVFLRIQNRTQVIHTVKYADKIVKVETVLQNITDKLTEIGR